MPGKARSAPCPGPVGRLRFWGQFATVEEVAGPASRTLDVTAQVIQPAGLSAPVHFSRCRMQRQEHRGFEPRDGSSGAMTTHPGSHNSHLSPGNSPNLTNFSMKASSAYPRQSQWCPCAGELKLVPFRDGSGGFGFTRRIFSPPFPLRCGWLVLYPKTQRPPTTKAAWPTSSHSTTSSIRRFVARPPSARRSESRLHHLDECFNLKTFHLSLENLSENSSA